MPVPGNESAHRLESAARTAEAAVAWEELTLARPAARTNVDSHANDMTVSRSASAAIPRMSPEAGGPNAFHAAIQLADGDAPPPAADTSATSETITAGAAGGAPASSLSGGMSDRDLDEVMRKLYPRLRRSLSSELLVARERAGVLADLR